MGLAYALASIGYFMLLELVWQVGHDAKPFVALVGLTGLPIVLDVLAFESALLLELTYEPLGVAAFAVGVLSVYLDDFQAIQLAGESDDPIIVLDDANRVRDYNTEARELFPSLTIGREIEGVVPEIAEYLDDDEAVVQIDRPSGMQYFQISTHPFTTGETRLGQAITLTDVTEREQYRTDLERQNERLNQFASVVSHDLRNPLNIARGRVELALETGDTDQLESARTALERMESLIEDMLTLARQGQQIADTEMVELSSVIQQAREVVDTAGATLTVESDLRFRADGDRLQQLLENLFRNAIEHGREDSNIRVGALEESSGFYVADDGPGIPEDEREIVFESAYSTTETGTGFGLSIVMEVVEAHGWTVLITDSWAGGARFEIEGVERE